MRHKGVEPTLLGNTSAGNFANLLSVSCQEDVFRVKDPFLISIADVSRAHFCLRRCGPRRLRPIARRRPQGKAARCKAQRWTERYAQILETGGFSRGVASPCHFFHKDLETYILVHGDDFFMVGRQEGREYSLSTLRSAYELSKVVTTDSEFLGQNTDIATMVESSTNQTSSMFPAP